jgi:hypothetical protein
MLTQEAPELLLWAVVTTRTLPEGQEVGALDMFQAFSGHPVCPGMWPKCWTAHEKRPQHSGEAPAQVGHYARQDPCHPWLPHFTEYSPCYLKLPELLEPPELLGAPSPGFLNIEEKFAATVDLFPRAKTH